MKELWELCEHGRAQSHPYEIYDNEMYRKWCPGGKKVHFEKLIIPNSGLFTSYIQGGSDEKNRIEVSSGHVYLIVDAGFMWIEED